MQALRIPALQRREYGPAIVFEIFLEPDVVKLTQVRRGQIMDFSSPELVQPAASVGTKPVSIIVIAMQGGPSGSQLPRLVVAQTVIYSESLNTRIFG